MPHSDFTGQIPNRIPSIPTQTPSKQQGSNGFKGLSARRPPPFNQFSGDTSGSFGGSSTGLIGGALTNLSNQLPEGLNPLTGLNTQPTFRQPGNRLPFPPSNQRLQVSNEPQEQLLSALSQNRGQNPPQFAKGGNVRRPAPFDNSRQNLRRF